MDTSKLTKFTIVQAREDMEESPTLWVGNKRAIVVSGWRHIIAPEHLAEEQDAVLEILRRSVKDYFLTRTKSLNVGDTLEVAIADTAQLLRMVAESARIRTSLTISEVRAAMCAPAAVAYFSAQGIGQKGQSLLLQVYIQAIRGNGFGTSQAATVAKAAARARELAEKLPVFGKIAELLASAQFVDEEDLI